MGFQLVTEPEKALRLLQYLKRYTDKDNPTSMPLIDYYFAEKGFPDYFGTKNSKRRTKRDLIKKLANILNTDIYGNPLPPEDRVIVYDGYGDEQTNKREFICNLYYNQPFSKYEIDDIINSIKGNSSLDNERKAMLIKKIEAFISNKNYTHSNQAVRRGMNAVEKKKFLIKQKQNKNRRIALSKQREDY